MMHIERLELNVLCQTNLLETYSWRSMKRRAQYFFLSVAQMNNEMFDWQEGKREEVMSREDSIDVIQTFASKPPPAPECKIPTLPELNALLVMSNDKLFFLAIELPHSKVKEWQLVRVAYGVTLNVHPECVQDGKYLVGFYTQHPEDVSYNAPNQRYWLEYHLGNSPISPDHHSSYHLIRPTTDSERYARANQLQPYRQWVYLNHEDCYLHGPFDFCVLPSGRKSSDRIAVDDWQVLHDYSQMFTNAPPRHDLRNYCSLHCSSSFHTKLKCTSQVVGRVMTAPLLTPSCYPEYQKIE